MLELVQPERLQVQIVGQVPNEQVAWQEGEMTVVGVTKRGGTL